MMMSGSNLESEIDLRNVVNQKVISRSKVLSNSGVISVGDSNNVSAKVVDAENSYDKFGKGPSSNLVSTLFP